MICARTNARVARDGRAKDLASMPQDGVRGALGDLSRRMSRGGVFNRTIWEMLDLVCTVLLAHEMWRSSVCQHRGFPARHASAIVLAIVNAATSDGPVAPMPLIGFDIFDEVRACDG